MVLLNSGSVATDSGCCCTCPDGQIKLQIDISWSISVSDTRIGFANCELNFSQSGSDTRTACETPGDWQERFSFFFGDTCPTSSGVCGRVFPAPFEDFLTTGEIDVNIGSGFPVCGCSCVCGAVGWNLECNPISVPDCSSGFSPCGPDDGSNQSEVIPDLSHPEGTYNFSDSASVTDYSWSWSLTVVITRL
jgi:hypothetical protein